MDTRRWPRFPFIAIVQAFDPASGIALTARTSDLSLGGCYVDSTTPLARGTVIKIEIVHKTESFIAKGRVVYSQPNMGMGISFLDIENDKQAILNRWVEELKASLSSV
jgi:PilZ domain